MSLVNAETGEIVSRESGWLASVDAATFELSQIERVDEAAEMVNAAEVAKVMARNVLRSREAMNHASHVSLLCQRRAGELLAASNLRARPQDGTVTDTLSATLGVESDAKAQQLSSRWQRIAAIPEDVFQEAIEKITSKGEELTTAGLIRTATGAHVGANSGDNEWYTPEPYITAARAVMGGIDLDPASSPVANDVVKADTIYTEDDNGLSRPWAGRVWMNPPYARPLIDSFAAKLAESYATGDVTEACVLVNNATETGWFHAMAEVASAMCFPRQRVKFWHPEKQSAPLQGQAVIYLGSNVDPFRNEFVQFGFTVTL